MRASSFLAPLFFAATSLAQAVEEGIAPASGPPEGCASTVEGSFSIGTLENPTLRHKRETAQEAADGDLLCTLEDGILHDQYHRTGSVVANRQFQFDGPPQAGAIYTGGFSICANGSLAIGGSTSWWRCMSGAFGNLYDEYIGAQCHEIRIQATFPETASSSTSSVSASTIAASHLADASSTPSASASDAASSPPSLSNSATSTSGSVVVTAFSTASPFSLSATASQTGASASSSPTGPAAAPPARTGAATSLSAARGATFGAIILCIGAVMLL